MMMLLRLPKSSTYICKRRRYTIGHTTRNYGVYSRFILGWNTRLYPDNNRKGPTNWRTGTFSTDSSGSQRQSNRSVEIVCSGCGIELQTDKKDASGYLPQKEVLHAAREQLRREQEERDIGYEEPNRYQRKQQTHGIICQRCYQSKHYGNLVPIQLPYDTFEQYLDAIRPLDCVVVQLIDVFDFHGSIIPNLKERIGENKPVILVLNKCDLLPKHTNYQRLEQWARKELKKMNISDVEDISCISAQRGKGIDTVLESIKKHRKGRDVYIIGTANVGKSTFVNRILHRIWASKASTNPRKQKKESKKNYAVVLDELPEGYEVNDTYVGDMEALLNEQRQLGQLKKLDAKTLEKLGIDEEGTPYPRSEVHESTPDKEDLHAKPRSSDVALDAVEDAAWEEIRNKSRVKKSTERTLEKPTISVRTEVASQTKLIDRQGKEVGKNRLAGTGDGPYSTAMNTAMTDNTNLPAPLRALPFEEAASLVGGDSKRASQSEGNLEQTPAMPLTTSPLPGTTLGVIGAPLVPGGVSRLYDTPGIISNEKKQQLMEYLSSFGPHTLKQILPQKTLRLTHYSLRPGRCMFLGGLVRIDYFHPVEDVHMLFTPATSLRTHITSTNKADELWEKHCNNLDKEDPLLFPSFGPLDDEHGYNLVDSIPWLRKRVYHGDPPKGGSPKRTRSRRQQRIRHSILDVALGGLGWVIVTPIEVKGMYGWERAVSQGSIRVRTVHGLDVHFREPILPHEASGTTPKHWRKHSEPRAVSLDKVEWERRKVAEHTIG